MHLQKLQYILAKVGGKHCVIIPQHEAYFKKGSIHIDNTKLDGTYFIQAYADIVTEIRIEYFFPGLTIDELVAELAEVTELFFTPKHNSTPHEYEYMVSTH